jgi:hypothetical protein
MIHLLWALYYLRKSPDRRLNCKTIAPLRRNVENFYDFTMDGKFCGREVPFSVSQALTILVTVHSFNRKKIAAFT